MLDKIKPVPIPSVWHALLIIFLFFGVGWIGWPIIWAVIGNIDYDPVGFPLTIQATGRCFPDGICRPFSWAAAVGNLVIWYLVSGVTLSQTWMPRSKNRSVRSQHGCGHQMDSCDDIEGPSLVAAWRARRGRRRD